MEIISSGFDEGEMIPKKYTCDDIDISPPLKWSSVPDGTKTMLLFEIVAYKLNLKTTIFLYFKN